MEEKTMPVNRVCPNCGSVGMPVFYELESVPVHSVLLLPTREEALSYPKGDIALGFCRTCGFISNVAFDPTLHEYSPQYEATQAFSPTFNTFHRNLAVHLIDRYDLHGKDIIEIGCGQGEFLTLLCELGGNRGVGFDPAYTGERGQSEAQAQITFIPDFYSEEYAYYQCDFLCCKMTLEHVQPTADFVSTVRRSVGSRPDTVVFFQVPDVMRILRELAFWDIYYEHCSYFSLGSLARLFRRCGFDVVDLWQDYDDQYLMLEARPGDGKGSLPLEQEDDLDALAQDVAHFCADYPSRLDQWRRDLQQIRSNGRRAVIWGAGSKGVAFLTTLNVQDEIAYAVDVNPYKRGTYMAGTGQEIVAPEFLQTYRPDVVIVMNPIYCDEIQRDLDRMGIAARLIPV
jgi:SAM-dependent methyltransferase